MILNLYDKQVKNTLKDGLNIVIINNYFVFDKKFHQEAMAAPNGVTNLEHSRRVLTETSRENNFGSVR